MYNYGRGDDMPVSKSQKKARDKYDKEHFEYATLKLRKGQKDKIKAHAESKGMSLNAYINELIDKDME